METRKVPASEQILQGALELIRDPKHWSKRSFAKDKDGVSVSTYDDSACSFCAIGALTVSARKWLKEKGGLKNCDNEGRFAHCTAIDYLIKSIESFKIQKNPRQHNLRISEVNDRSTHEEILSYFNKAIELASRHYN